MKLLKFLGILKGSMGKSESLPQEHRGESHNLQDHFDLLLQISGFLLAQLSYDRTYLHVLFTNPMLKLQDPSFYLNLNWKMISITACSKPNQEPLAPHRQEGISYSFAPLDNNHNHNNNENEIETYKYI